MSDNSESVEPVEQDPKIEHEEPVEEVEVVENDADNDEEVHEEVEVNGDDVEMADNGNCQNEPEVDPIFEQSLLNPLFERRDKSLKELLDAMDEFSPIIPDAVIDYYLTKAGFKSSDHRIKRLLALATQKFVADIVGDAYQLSRIRAQTATMVGGSGRGRAGPGSTSGRTVLTMESLSGVLGDYGINPNRADFYR